MMKPKILCGECQQPIELGSKFCNHCGKPVNWSAEGMESSGEIVQCERCGAENNATNSICSACGETLVSKARTPQHEKERRSARKKNAEKPATMSWQMVAGFVVIIAVVVFGLELLTAKKFEEVPHNHDEETQPASANMQALQQIQDMEQRLSANPEDQALRLQLANLLHDARFYDKAIQSYNEYLTKSPKDVDARVDLGICYYEVDKTSEAKQQMIKALEYNPKHVLGHFNLGIVHLRIAQSEMTAGNTEKANAAVTEANEWFRKTVALDPNGSAGQRAQRFLADHSSQLNPQPNLLTN